MSDTPNFKTAMEFAYGVPRVLAPGVVRIVANNPSPFTYKGTNTYLVGETSLAVIDPGPGDPAHTAATLAAIAGRTVTHIVITHTHRDHTDGMPALLAATGARTVGYGRKTRGDAPKLGAAANSGERFDQDFSPDIVLKDGERLAGAGWSLEAIFTPGHAPDHLCFALGDANGPTGIVFSGDHVMAWNTSVVAPPEGHMGRFIASLEKMMARTDRVYYPGHGGQTDEPQRFVKALLLHRHMRENSILECIRTGAATAKDIVPVVYKGLDERLIPAAALSVLAHVEHLAERGLIRLSGPLALEARLSCV